MAKDYLTATTYAVTVYRFESRLSLYCRPIPGIVFFFSLYSTPIARLHTNIVMLIEYKIYLNLIETK